MKPVQIVGRILCAFGMMLFVAGLAGPAIAITCNASDLIQETKCDGAHAKMPQLPPDDDTSCYVVPGYPHSCIPGPGSTCADQKHYQVAVAGECVNVLENSVSSSCIEDYGSTFIELRQIEFDCQRFHTCDCVPVRANGPSQYSEVCTCYHIEE